MQAQKSVENPKDNQAENLRAPLRAYFIILSPAHDERERLEFPKLPLPARAGGKDLREIVFKRVFTRIATLRYSVSFRLLLPQSVVVGVRQEVFLVSVHDSRKA